MLQPAPARKPRRALLRPLGWKKTPSTTSVVLVPGCRVRSASSTALLAMFLRPVGSFTPTKNPAVRGASSLPDRARWYRPVTRSRPVHGSSVFPGSCAPP